MNKHHPLLSSQQRILNRIQKHINLEFHNQLLLMQAVSHSSYVNESTQELLSNERLEFLGDAVLDLIIIEHLYHLHPTTTEGELALIKSSLVCEASLALVARNLELGQFLFFSSGEFKGGGREKPAILADALEALIGAIYLDLGMESTRRFILTYFDPLLQESIANPQVKDAKSKLQERLQQANCQPPIYKITKEWGEDHQKQYEATIYIGDEPISCGIGRNKKTAHQQAAARAYQRLYGDT